MANDKNKSEIVQRIIGILLIIGGIVMSVLFGLSFTDIWWNGSFPPIFMILIGFFMLPCGAILIMVSYAHRMRKRSIEMNREALSAVAPQLLPKSVCPYCGSEILHGTSFCTACGRSVAPITCNKCGEDNPCSATFCQKCGNRLI